MSRYRLAAVCGGMLLLVGCGESQFSSQPLGPVGYTQAFDAAKAALSEHFPIERADAETGRIVSRPKQIEAAPDRLLGSSSARQVATVRIRREGGDVVADVRVETQRQDLTAMRQLQPVTLDSERPGTPAEEGGAYSAEQDQAWQVAGRDEALERKILVELLRRLEGPPQD